MKKVIFAVGTEYHLLMSIILATTIYRNQAKVILIRLDQSNLGYIDKIQKMGIWDEVHVTKIENDDQQKKVLASLLDEASIYHFFSWGYPEFVYLFNLCTDAGVKIALTDEGLLSYSPTRRFTGWLMQNPNHMSIANEINLQKADEIWLVSPSIFGEALQWPLRQIPVEDFVNKCRNDIHLLDMFCDLFDLPKTIDLKADAIYFRQYYGLLGVLPPEVDIWVDKIICESFENSRFLIKNHPRYSQNQYLMPGGGFIAENEPWEATVILSAINSSTKTNLPSVYISITSSAMFKTAMLGVIGTYIFINKITDRYATWSDNSLDDLIDKLKANYPESTFLVPSDWEDLKNCLQEVSIKSGVEINLKAFPSKENERKELHHFYLTNLRKYQLLQFQCEEQNVLITSLQSQYAEQNEQITYLQSQWTEQNEHITSLQSEILEKGHEQTIVQENLAEQERTNQLLRSQLAASYLEKEKINDSQKLIIQTLNDSLEVSQQEILQYVQSNSWKITRPFRKLKRFLTRK